MGAGSSMRCLRVSRNSARLSLLTLIVCSFSVSTFGDERASSTTAPEGKLQAIVSELKSRLQITSPIVVTIVPSNDLMMSVEAPTETRRTFLLSVEARFLDTLTDSELEAAVAHELGHVWIFTHHPFLQTEELANKIAMRAVTRDPSARSIVTWMTTSRHSGRPVSRASAAESAKNWVLRCSCGSRGGRSRRRSPPRWG